MRKLIVPALMFAGQFDYLREEIFRDVRGRQVDDVTSVVAVARSERAPHPPGGRSDEVCDCEAEDLLAHLARGMAGH